MASGMRFPMAVLVHVEGCLLPKIHQIMRPEECRIQFTSTSKLVLEDQLLTKRCVFLTGPYKVNGVPLRRVNQSYVIATSTKVNIEGLELPAIDDAYFAKEKAAKKSKEEQFFAQSSAVSFHHFPCDLL